MFGKFRIYFIATVAALNCSGLGSAQEVPKSEAVSLSNVASMASELDGRVVSIDGILIMTDKSQNIVSTLSVDSQICVGIITTKRNIEVYKKFNKKFVRASGRFFKDGCGQTLMCLHACGPYTLELAKVELVGDHSSPIQ